MFEYFVSGSYAAATEGNSGYCNFNIVRNSPIARMEDIREIEEWVRQQQNWPTFVILNYVLMREFEAEMEPTGSGDAPAPVWGSENTSGKKLFGGLFSKKPKEDGPWAEKEKDPWEV